MHGGLTKWHRRYQGHEKVNRPTLGTLVGTRGNVLLRVQRRRPRRVLGVSEDMDIERFISSS